MIFDKSLDLNNLDGKNPYPFNIYPNPAKNHVFIDFELDKSMDVDYFITNNLGEIVDQGSFDNTKSGMNSYKVKLKKVSAQNLTITLSIDDVYYLTKKVIKQ